MDRTKARTTYSLDFVTTNLSQHILNVGGGILSGTFLNTLYFKLEKNQLLTNSISVPNYRAIQSQQQVLLLFNETLVHLKV